MQCSIVLPRTNARTEERRCTLRVLAVPAIRRQSGRRTHGETAEWEKPPARKFLIQWSISFSAQRCGRGGGGKPNRRGSRYAKHASKVLYTTARNVSGSAGGQVCFTRSCSRTALADDIRPNWCGACWPLCTHTHKHTGVVCGVIVKRWRKRI